MDRLTAANEQVQQLIDDWKEVQVNKYRVEEAERKILARIHNHCGGYMGKALIVLEGLYEALRIRPRLNVRYERARGEQHPLKRLSEQFSQLPHLLRISYLESGKKIERLIEEYDQEGHGGLSADDCELVKAILEVRSVSEGKPAIEAVRLQDNDDKDF